MRKSWVPPAAAVLAVLSLLLGLEASAQQQLPEFSTDLKDIRTKISEAPAPPKPKAVPVAVREDSTSDHLNKAISEKIRSSPVLKSLGFEAPSDRPITVKRYGIDYVPGLNVVPLILGRLAGQSYMRKVTLELSYNGIRRTFACDATVRTDFEHGVISECLPVEAEYHKGNVVRRFHRVPDQYDGVIADIPGWPVQVEQRKRVKAISFGGDDDSWDVLIKW